MTTVRMVATIDIAKNMQAEMLREAGIRTKA